MSEIAVSFFSMLTIIIPAVLLHKQKMSAKEKELLEEKRKNKEHLIKADVLDKVLEFASFNAIKEAVEELFSTTRADRFLVLIAVNGKVDFNMISVIFEQHKKGNSKVNAIARYRSLSIDSKYREMLKESEKNGMLIIKTADMDDCLLRQIYEIEGVQESMIRHLIREHIDDDNDVLVYSSLATHDKRGFTPLGRTKANIMYDSTIKGIIEDVLKKNDKN